MASDRPSTVDYLIIAILLAFFNSLFAAGQQQAPVATGPPTEIIIPNLPLSHYQFWLKNNPSALRTFEEICSQSAIQDINDKRQLFNLYSNLTFEGPRSADILDTICSKVNLVRKSCWGYESNCEIIYLMPECNSTSSDSQSEQEKKVDWFSQADFGFILDRRREQSSYCAPEKYSNHSIKSSLECTKYFRTCRGKNLYIKFDDVPIILKKGQVGGWNCDLQIKRIEEEAAHSGSFLRSWFNELKHYQKFEVEPATACEERVEKQAYLVKLDSSANMYHYFCSFLNLYATMHLNNRFSEDNQLILWDKKLPNSPYEEMWSVFSKNPPKSLNEFKGKQVCFKKFIFAMPPRMLNGLYYSTSLVKGCSKSGLFDAFNKHVLHKLKIDKYEHELKINDHSVVRVTIVSRSTTSRKILNENDLKIAADSISTEFQSQVVDFANMTFLDQLKIVHNTDILVGVHGAGLTHTLFLPDWAALFELYDCKDECYRDLARLRGVSYFTLRDGENSGEKSINFKVDVDNFVEVLRSAAQEIKKRRGDSTENSLAGAKLDNIESELGKSDPPKTPEVVPKKQQPHTEL